MIRRDEVLAVVNEAGDWITAREIAERIGMHQATVSEHLRTLELQGMIQSTRFRNCFGWASLGVEGPTVRQKSRMSVDEFRKKQKEEGPAGFRAAFTQAAEMLGWIVVHFPNMLGNPQGWPDCLCLRNGVALFVELKVGKNQPTPAQLAWQATLQAQGFDAYVFWPDDWPEIEAVLA